MEFKIPKDDASFSDLQEFVYRTYHKDILDFNFPYHGDPLYKAIENEPIGRRKIDSLKNNGWKIIFGTRFPKSSWEFEGLCLLEEKEVWILERLNGYSRDKAICHEIVHAVYGNVSLDYPILYRKKDQNELTCRRNNALVEWYSRQVRSTPALLSSIWQAFGINPLVYDRASLMASDYPLYGKQRLFPSFYNDFNFTLMD